MTNMKKSPLISIILTTYNRRDLLPYAIQSVLDQTYTNYEIIVVNDFGEDVWDIIQSFNSEKIKYLCNIKNSGPSFSRNTAIGVAKGSIICYLDDDDIFLPMHLKTIINTMQSERADIVYTKALYVDEKIENGQRIILNKYLADRDNRYSADKLMVFNFIPVNTIAHRRSLIQGVGDFNEELESHEDWEFFIRLSRQQTFLHIDKQTVEIHIREFGEKSRTQREQDNFYNIYKKIYKMYPSQKFSILKKRHKILYHLSTGSKSLSHFCWHPLHDMMSFYYRIRGWKL